MRRVDRDGEILMVPSSTIGVPNTGPFGIPHPWNNFIIHPHSSTDECPEKSSVRKTTIRAKESTLNESFRAWSPPCPPFAFDNLVRDEEEDSSLNNLSFDSAPRRPPPVAPT